MEMVEKAGTQAHASGSKALNVSLWVVQVLLAALFGFAGAMKLAMPIDQLAQKMPWVATAAGAGLVRFIGLSELSAAIGLILPAVTRIKPVLTAWAGVGLVVVMVLAAMFHLTRGEASGILFTTVLGGLAAFVAWGRLRRAPIAARAGAGS